MKRAGTAVVYRWKERSDNARSQIDEVTNETVGVTLRSFANVAKLLRSRLVLHQYTWDRVRRGWLLAVTVRAAYSEAAP